MTDQIQTPDLRIRLRKEGAMFNAYLHVKGSNFLIGSCAHAAMEDDALFETFKKLMVDSMPHIMKAIGMPEVKPVFMGESPGRD